MQPMKCIVKLLFFRNVRGLRIIITSKLQCSESTVSVFPKTGRDVASWIELICCRAQRSDLSGMPSNTFYFAVRN